MQINTEPKPKSEILFKIEVAPQEYQPFMIKAAAKLSREVKIEGFRPGKAPYDIVKQKGGNIKTIPFINGFSTTQIIEKLNQ